MLALSLLICRLLGCQRHRVADGSKVGIATARVHFSRHAIRATHLFLARNPLPGGPCGNMAEPIRLADLLRAAALRDDVDQTAAAVGARVVKPDAGRQAHRWPLISRASISIGCAS